jgi:hypothetical protein
MGSGDEASIFRQLPALVARDRYHVTITISICVMTRVRVGGVHTLVCRSLSPWTYPSSYPHHHLNYTQPAEH